MSSSEGWDIENLVDLCFQEEKHAGDHVARSISVQFQAVDPPQQQLETIDTASTHVGLTRSHVTANNGPWQQVAIAGCDDNVYEDLVDTSLTATDCQQSSARDLETTEPGFDDLEAEIGAYDNFTSSIDSSVGESPPAASISNQSMKECGVNGSASAVNLSYEPQWSAEESFFNSLLLTSSESLIDCVAASQWPDCFSQVPDDGSASHALQNVDNSYAVTSLPLQKISATEGEAAWLGSHPNLEQPVKGSRDQMSSLIEQAPSFRSNDAGGKKDSGVTVRKDKRTPQEKRPVRRRKVYPIALGIAKNKVPYLKFTLEEEFLLEQVVTASSLLINLGNKQAVNRFPAQSLQFFSEAVRCSLTEEKIQPDPDYFLSSSSVIKETVLEQGHCLLSALGTKISPNLVPALTQYSFNAYYILSLAVFFGNSRAASLIEQEKAVGITDQTVWAFFLEEVPMMEAATSLQIEDFTLLCQEAAQPLKHTLLALSQIIARDEKVAALAYLLVLASQPQESPYWKSRHLKDLRTFTATILYRYLSSKGDKSSREAADLTYSLTGHLQHLHECGSFFFGALEQLRAMTVS